MPAKRLLGSLATLYKRIMKYFLVHNPEFIVASSLRFQAPFGNNFLIAPTFSSVRLTGGYFAAGQTLDAFINFR